MRAKYIAGSIVVAVMMLTGSSRAQVPFTESQLAEMQTARYYVNECRLDTREAHCLGYINGFVEGFYRGQVQARYMIRTGGPNRICELPDNVNTGQIEKIFLKYMDDHPERLHESVSVMLLASLSGVLTCN